MDELISYETSVNSESTENKNYKTIIKVGDEYKEIYKTIIYAPLPESNAVGRGQVGYMVI